MKHGENFITKNVNLTVDVDVARTMLRMQGFRVDDYTDEQLFYKTIGVANSFGLKINDDKWQNFVDKRFCK